MGDSPTIGGRMIVLLTSILLSLSAIAAPGMAHGADTFSVIMRGSLIQPYSFEVSLNDTVLLENVADWNRTVRLDNEGDGLFNGTLDVNCLVETVSTCSIWLDPVEWTAGEYLIEVMENDSVGFTLNMTVIGDEHHDETSSETDDNNTDAGVDQGGLSSEDVAIWMITGGAFAAFIYFALRSRKAGMEEE